MTLKYLIVGATGGLGRYVLDYFVANKPLHEFAAASSRESNRKQFEDRGIAFRQVNYDDPATLDTAFQDVENVLFVSTNTFDNEKRRKQHQNFVDAAKRNAVQHVWTFFLFIHSSYLVLFYIVTVVANHLVRCGILLSLLEDSSPIQKPQCRRRI